MSGAEGSMRRELRKFAFALTGVAAVFALLLLWRRRETASDVFFVLSGYALLSALLFPPAIRPVRWALLKIGHALGWFNTRLILILLFYLVFTPIGLLLRLFGKDLLNRRLDPDAATYWVDREKEPFDPKRYERQF
jgi:cytochrome c biogenesis factor